MRALILAATVLGVLASANPAQAGLSTTPREVSASVDTATVPDEATQKTEDQIGLTKATRRSVQRRLAKLGFETKVNGKFDDSTRASITRWQEEHDYPTTGYLNTAQHAALLNERVATTEIGGDDGDDHPGRRGVRAHRSRSVGGPIGAIGGLMGGLFGRR
jgi:peptidoglycan hydrolase-like protein with peptidoglycan-binding domain